MTTAETISFEGLVPPYGYLDHIFSYAGFTWNHTGVSDRARNPEDPNGYNAVVHQRVYAFNSSAQHAQFTSTTPFSLESGHFAAAWNTGLTVVFRAYLDGVKVGHLRVTLDQVDTLIKFPDSFKHIDGVAILSGGGVEGTGSGEGPHVGFDNLKVVFDGDIPADPAAAPHEAARLMHLHDAQHGTGYTVHDILA